MIQFGRCDHCGADLDKFMRWSESDDPLKLQVYWQVMRSMLRYCENPKVPRPAKKTGGMSFFGIDWAAGFVPSCSIIAPHFHVTCPICQAQATAMTERSSLSVRNLLGERQP